LNAKTVLLPFSFKNGNVYIQYIHIHFNSNAYALQLGVGDEMITTVTTTTTTVVATTTTTTAAISIAASLAIIGTIVLISLLIAKELLSSHKVEQKLFLSDRLSIAIVPLLMMFALVVITKIVDAFRF
jgi:hypothetical protein